MHLKQQALFSSNLTLRAFKYNSQAPTNQLTHDILHNVPYSGHLTELQNS